MSKANRISFLKRLGTEIMYFKYDYENAIIKSVPGKGHWVKFKGKPAFKAHPDSKLVADAILENVEVTQDEYDNF